MENVIDAPSKDTIVEALSRFKLKFALEQLAIFDPSSQFLFDAFQENFVAYTSDLISIDDYRLVNNDVMEKAYQFINNKV